MINATIIKLGYFERDCFFSNKWLNIITQQLSEREKSQKKDPRKDKSKIQSKILNPVHQATKNKSAKYKNKSNLKLFIPDLIGTIFMVEKKRFQKLGTNSPWFLDLYAFHHFCNDQKHFSILKAKSINFVMAIK